MNNEMPVNDIIEGLLGAARDHSSIEFEMILKRLDENSLFEVSRTSASSVLEANMIIAEGAGHTIEDISSLLLFPGDEFLGFDKEKQMMHLKIGIWLSAIWVGPVSKLNLIWKSMNYIERYEFTYNLVIMTCAFEDAVYGAP